MVCDDFCVAGNVVHISTVNKSNKAWRVSILLCCVQYKLEEVFLRPSAPEA